MASLSLGSIFRIEGVGERRQRITLRVRLLSGWLRDRNAMATDDGILLGMNVAPKKFEYWPAKRSAVTRANVSNRSRPAAVRQRARGASEQRGRNDANSATALPSSPTRHASSSGTLTAPLRPTAKPSHWEGQRPMEAEAIIWILNIVLWVLVVVAGIAKSDRM
jgi:hypothetical protein